MPALLIGILIAAGLFAATLWSGSQIYRQSGALRMAHAACLTLTLFGMAALSVQLPLPATLAGAGLAPAAILGLVREIGWSRLLPLIQLLFAGVLLSGLPFAGG